MLRSLVAPLKRGQRIDGSWLMTKGCLGPGPAVSATYKEILEMLTNSVPESGGAHENPLSCQWIVPTGCLSNIGWEIPENKAIMTWHICLPV